MRYQGKITEWRDEKGFGFITPNGGGERAFLHIKAFTSRARRPVGNELVNFVLTRDDKGRPRAEQVEYVSNRRKPPPRTVPGASSTLLLFAGFFLVIVGILTAMSKLPLVVVLCYLGLSVLTFGFYAADKSAAMEGRWRTAEGTLQLLALLGGWPGALFAQQLLRHKSSKGSFQVVFWMVVAANLTAFGWLFSSAGSKFLAQLSHW